MGTWNVNARGKEESLDDWLCADWGPNNEFSPDIVVVGFQEIVDLNAVNVMQEKNSAQRSQAWVDKLRLTLNSRKYTKGDPMRTYSCLSHRHLVGLLICLFVKTPHQPRVKHLHNDAVACGLGGVLGNKGGVSIRLQFYDSTLCFVCSHLAAHRENVLGRNADFHNIFNKTTFEIGEDAVQDVIRNGSLQQWSTGSSSVGIAAHDLVFWFGDLNYRIDECMTIDEVIQACKKGDIAELELIDQLNIERAQGRAFSGWNEGPLNFMPTYKYQPGTDNYECRPDKKLRAPAWCDRVLWLAADESHAEQISYTRSEINISDHKPVMSTFAITIKDVIQSKREMVNDDVMKRLDKHENSSLPMVVLDRAILDFGDIRYDQVVTLPITIINTGKVIAQFRFVPKLDEIALCKPWLTVSPTYGMLIPGEKEEVINFSITIDNATAQALNGGREVLKDILILHLENGRDYYITVTASYARSSFGMSVDELVMISEPIRNVPLDPIKRAETQDSHNALCVPKELWRIVDYIYERGVHEKDLFATPGIPHEMYEIRECLDTGDPFADYKVHSMTEILLSFLSNLSAPIIPPTVFANAEIDAQNIQAISRKLLEELPPIHYNVFVYIISFFRECLFHKDQNCLSASKLARICCNCFVTNEHDNIEESALFIQHKAGMQMIILLFLETSSI